MNGINEGSASSFPQDAIHSWKEDWTPSQEMIEDGGTESSFSHYDKQSGVENWTPPNKESFGEELIAPIGNSFE